ncbi:MAG: hypothetical protein LKJ80_02100 [Oscillibacter sp.]|jgi:hypothetical protein|nr:hypothetical protein [Oscillibacter sp.]
MDISGTFLYQNIRTSGKQRFFDLSILYILAIFGIFAVCLSLCVRELGSGFAGGWAGLFAFVFAAMAGALSYGNYRYLSYGLKIYRHPERARFLSLLGNEKSFAELCAEVEAERDVSLLSGIKNVTVTDSYLYVKQRGYFELYRRSDIQSLELDGDGRVLCFTHRLGGRRELTRFWDDQAVPRLLEMLCLRQAEPGPAADPAEARKLS